MSPLVNDFAPGGDAARAVGMALTPSRIALLALAACLTATATMTIGPLSFVGLMAPHIARMLGFRRTMPHMVISALAGGVYWSLPTGAAGWRYFRIRSRRDCFQALLARRILSICYVNRAGKKGYATFMSGGSHAQPDLQITQYQYVVAIFCRPKNS